MNLDDELRVRDHLDDIRPLAPPTDDIWAAISARASTAELTLDLPERRRGGRWLAVAALLLVLAGGAALLGGRHRLEPQPLHTAGTPTSSAPARAAGALSGTVTITQAGDGRIRLCATGRTWKFGATCGGPEVTGWDWTAVGGGTKTADGERTGRYTVTGHLGDGAFAVTSARVATGGSDPPQGTVRVGGDRQCQGVTSRPRRDARHRQGAARLRR